MIERNTEDDPSYGDLGYLQGKLSSCDGFLILGQSGTRAQLLA